MSFMILNSEKLPSFIYSDQDIKSWEDFSLPLSTFVFNILSLLNLIAHGYVSEKLPYSSSPVILSALKASI